MITFEALKIGSNLLREHRIESHLIDSEILLSKTLNTSREQILTNLNKKVDENKISKFKNYIKRRCRKEPIAYILEEKEFWSKKFKVTSDVLIPRPETELLVEQLTNNFEGKKISILDIGTGSGCIIISLLCNLNQSYGLGIDISEKAIKIARDNAVKHNLFHKLKFTNKSFESVINKKFDLIVSNPPYIDRNLIKNLSDDIKKFEPRMALDGGNDGLDLVKKVIYKSKYILKIKGTLALEIGNEQIKKVSKILIDNKFRTKQLIKDYRNNVRGVIATFKQ